VKRVLLIGAGHAHLVVLRSLLRRPLYGASFMLVAPQPKQIYSGMLPGLVAGHYRLDEIQVDLPSLAERARAEFFQGEAEWIDPARRFVRLRGGEELEYDLVSLNLGSAAEQSIPGSRDHALAVKPFDDFVTQLGRRKPARIAIAGAGAAGIELAMALRYRGAVVSLYSDKPGLSPAVASMAMPALRRLGVDFRPGMPVDAIEPGPVVVSSASRQEFDTVVMATGAAAPPWLRATTLATDQRGFVLVDAGLRSVSNPDVFAAGDCATLRDAPQPKSGVYSVRQGATLDENLRNVVARAPLERYAARARALALISCGDKYAIAERGSWTAEGAWIWRWKDWIDRRWMRSLAGR
jgi:selenide,water dikinase